MSHTAVIGGGRAHLRSEGRDARRNAGEAGNCGWRVLRSVCVGNETGFFGARAAMAFGVIGRWCPKVDSPGATARRGGTAILVQRREMAMSP